MRVLIAHASTTARDKIADIVRLLEHPPVDVIAVGDGAETLDLLLQDDPPEVALVDWDLPGVEGPEMCRLVRDFHHGHDTWIVVLASTSREDTADAWRAGADDCVSTPASAAALRDCVANGLRRMRPPVADDRVVRASLDAVCRDDDGGGRESFAEPTTELRATMDPEDRGAPAHQAARPELTAQWVDRPEPFEGPRGPAVLEALLTKS